MRRQPFMTALVGPSALLREGLARILGTADFRIVASGSCVADLALSQSSQQQPTLLIIDAGDEPRSAVQQIEAFEEQRSAARIAVVADHLQLGELVWAFRAGANAYFIKVSNCDAFIKSLELVMLGETILPPAILSFIFDYDGDHEDGYHSELVRNGVRETRAGEPWSRQCWRIWSVSPARSDPERDDRFECPGCHGPVAWRIHGPAWRPTYDARRSHSGPSMAHHQQRVRSHR